MKKIYALVTVLLLMGTMVMKAQNTMVVTKTDGTKVEIKIAEIQDVTFEEMSNLLVDINYYKRFWLHPEQWIQLVTTIYQDGEEIDARIEWESTDDNVATVDKYGKVTGVGDGECKILAKVEGAQGEFAINVVTEPQLDLNVYEIGNRTCRYTITPKNPDTKYYYNLRIQSGSYSVDNFDQYGSEEQNMLHYTRDWWSFVADLYGTTWVEYMNESALTDGPIDVDETDTNSDGLIPGEKYCLYAFGLDSEGELTTPIEVTKFTTTKPENVDMTFECEFNEIYSSDATFTITPSNQDEPYFVNVQRASYVDWFIDNDQMNDMVTSLIGGFSPTMYPEAYCKGTVTRQMTDFLGTVRSDNDYYVIVFGYNEGQTTPVQVFGFRTKP